MGNLNSVYELQIVIKITIFLFVLDIKWGKNRENARDYPIYNATIYFHFTEYIEMKMSIYSI